MVSPQLENGYTSLANELLDRFCSLGVSGGEFRLILFVVRKTYGYHKKLDRISLSQFQKGTGMSRSHVCLGLKSLVLKQVLVRENGGYKLNKSHDQWVVLRKVPPVLRLGTPSTKASTKTSTKASTHKRKKETNTKEITTADASRQVEQPKYNPLGAQIIKAFSEFNPACEKYYDNKTQRAACDRLIETHGLEKVLQVIKILPKTNTMRYVPTITTPYVLDDRWASLEAAMLKKKVEQLDTLSKYKVAFH